jgi:hypothetical protein
MKRNPNNIFVNASELSRFQQISVLVFKSDSINEMCETNWKNVGQQDGAVWFSEHSNHNLKKCVTLVQNSNL